MTNAEQAEGAVSTRDVGSGLRWHYYCKHYATLFAGLLAMSAAVAMAKISELGVSPISSVPNVLSFMTPLTIGQTTMVFMTLVIASEAVVLGKAFGWKNVVQIVPTLVFGELIDFFVSVFGFLSPHNYAERAALLLLATVILAIGVLLEVNSRTVMMAGEGIAAAFAQRLHKPFATMKVYTDTTMVVMAVVLSLVFLHGLVGVREGTIVAALLTGRIVGFIERHLSGAVRWIRDDEMSAE